MSEWGGEDGGRTGGGGGAEEGGDRTKNKNPTLMWGKKQGFVGFFRELAGS